MTSDTTTFSHGSPRKLTRSDEAKVARLVLAEVSGLCR